MKVWKIFDTLKEANSLTRIFKVNIKFSIQVSIDDEKFVATSKTDLSRKLQENGYSIELYIALMDLDITNYGIKNPIEVTMGRTNIKLELETLTHEFY